MMWVACGKITNKLAYYSIYLYRGEKMRNEQNILVIHKDTNDNDIDVNSEKFIKMLKNKIKLQTKSLMNEYIKLKN